MFFFVCHHHGKQVVKFGSKRVLVCSFYFSYPLLQMNVSRVLEDSFHKTLWKHHVFFASLLEKKWSFIYACLLMTRSGGALTDDPNPATILHKKRHFLCLPSSINGWLCGFRTSLWKRFMVVQTFKHESSLTSSQTHHLIYVYIIVKCHSAILRNLKLDLLSGALWALCIWHNTHCCFFFAVRCKTTI